MPAKEKKDLVQNPVPCFMVTLLSCLKTNELGSEECSGLIHAHKGFGDSHRDRRSIKPRIHPKLVTCHVAGAVRNCARGVNGSGTRTRHTEPNHVISTTCPRLANHGLHRPIVSPGHCPFRPFLELGPAIHPVLAEIENKVLSSTFAIFEVADE